jgi:hypothetical protein
MVHMSQIEPQTSAYGSARDLPSFQEMNRQIQGAKLLTLFIARDQRKKLLDIERQMAHLAEVVDRFYDRLGPRHWIFHDSLNVSSVESILNDTTDPEETERRFIALYQDPGTTKFWMLRLRHTNGIRERFHQVERARIHYDAGHFDSCTLQLISVVDGFVNDFDAAQRRGLAARDSESMVAWDSVVGHHMGLTHALTEFNRTIKKRVDEEVFELNRHGIVHGTIVRFDNVVVATKAWNLLFAVADWAVAVRKEEKPTRKPPRLWDSIKQMAETQKVKRKIEQWEASSLSIVDPGFKDHLMLSRTADFMNAWRARNFGVMSGLASYFVRHDESSGRVAGLLRSRFDGFLLTQFEVTELENDAPAIWLTRGTATVNGEIGAFECRWILEEDDGTTGFGSETAEWRLVFCDPSIWRRPA